MEYMRVYIGTNNGVIFSWNHLVGLFIKIGSVIEFKKLKRWELP